MKIDLFQSCGHCWVFQICWHIEHSSFTESFSIWFQYSSSAGIPSPPLVLFILMLPKAHLTLYSKMSGSRWVITPLWLSRTIPTFKSWLVFLVTSPHPKANSLRVTSLAWQRHFYYKKFQGFLRLCVRNWRQKWDIFFTIPQWEPLHSMFSKMAAMLSRLAYFFFVIQLTAPGLSRSMGDLVPWPRDKPGLPTLETWRLNHWTH